MSLGPLLGIEGDYDYSLVVFLPRGIDAKSLTLEWSFNDEESEAKPSPSSDLRMNKAYRFEIPIKRQLESYVVSYRLLLEGLPLSNSAGDSEWQFVVPGEDTVPKIGFASCNGSSKDLPSDVPDTEYVMWEELWQAHTKEELDYSFHCLLLCGDQIYADPIWEAVPYFREKGLLGWRSTKKFSHHKIDAGEHEKLTSDIIEFYEQLYIASWSKPSVSKILASIPSAMMWDDHDIIDGWGSYPEPLQNCDIFDVIFEVAEKYFEIFQIRTRSNRALISDQYYTQKFSFRNFEIIILDNRSFRTCGQIMSDQQYADLRDINESDLFLDCPAALEDQRVVLFAIPVPLAHLNYKRRVESWLRWLVKSDFRKSFDDDALDHWDHHRHEAEQKRLIDQIFEFGDSHDPKYVHIVSGDVHSAGAGRIKRTAGTKRYVNQAISSAIVHRPIDKIAQWIVSLVANHVSEIEGYTVRTDKFGIGPNAPVTIYDRNFGFLYKAEGKGLKFYLALEHSENDYEWDQPPMFRPDRNAQSVAPNPDIDLIK